MGFGQGSIKRTIGLAQDVKRLRPYDNRASSFTARIGSSPSVKSIARDKGDE
jgi:hypothetical protein